MGADSFAFHSDGTFRCEDDANVRQISDHWEEGDVIGVGIDYRTGLFFVTRNGLYIGTNYLRQTSVDSESKKA